MKVAYTHAFLRQLWSLEDDLQKETLGKIELFKEKKNHRILKVHKLKGRLAGRFSFSVDFRYRIIFTYLSKDEAVLHAIGDHDVYK